jgi:hypothetical protein
MKTHATRKKKRSGTEQREMYIGAVHPTTKGSFDEKFEAPTNWAPKS